ncbi:MAG: ATP-binding protein [Bacteroidota bacterium]
MSKNPTLNLIVQNAQTLQRELEWFAQVLDTRFNLYFGKECQYTNIYEVPVPELAEAHSIYSDIIQHFGMSVDERLVLLLALAPHVCPQLLDIFFTKNETYGRGFTEFGGIRGNQHSGFLPTGETATFLLSANDLTRRFQVAELFDPDHFFAKHKILQLVKDKSGEPMLSGALIISREYLSYFSSGQQYKPSFSMEFPAQRITTHMEWEDLVLEGHILEEVEEIHTWLVHHKTLLNEWGMAKRIKPGYRSLFYGPPGTGKTLTASLLGKTTGLDVYRVDLSKVVSKYIGETEKNLANIFDQAENKNWILFFDEADALFGKRTAANDSKDRHANQEVAYLLQRVEDFPGVVILATNLKTNIDEAFARRFQSMIYFPMPRPAQRLRLWSTAFPEPVQLGKGLDLSKIAEEYEIAGGAINNISLHCSLRALVRGDNCIYKHDLIDEIRREFRKEGKTV